MSKRPEEAQEGPQSGEILGPQDESPNNPVGDNYIALISQYTERPDLLIDTLEKHDPGFVVRMNKKAEESADRMRLARFWFGGVQAYAGLAVSVIAALTILGLVAFMVITSKASFWTIIALVVFYAISQGGPSGFMEMCRGVADFFRNRKGPSE